MTRGFNYKAHNAPKFCNLRLAVMYQRFKFQRSMAESLTIAKFLRLYLKGLDRSSLSNFSQNLCAKIHFGLL